MFGISLSSHIGRGLKYSKRQQWARHLGREFAVAAVNEPNNKPAHTIRCAQAEFANLSDILKKTELVLFMRSRVENLSKNEIRNILRNVLSIKMDNDPRIVLGVLSRVTPPNDSITSDITDLVLKCYDSVGEKQKAISFLLKLREEPGVLTTDNVRQLLDVLRGSKFVPEGITLYKDIIADPAFPLARSDPLLGEMALKLCASASPELMEEHQEILADTVWIVEHLEASHIKPHPNIYSQLLVVGGISRNMQFVRAIKEKVDRDVGPALRCSNAYMAACNDCGDPEACVHEFEFLLDSYIIPDGETMAHALTAYSTLGRPAEGLRHLRAWAREGHKIDWQLLDMRRRLRTQESQFSSPTPDTDAAQQQHHREEGAVAGTGTGTGAEGAVTDPVLGESSVPVRTPQHSPIGNLLSEHTEQGVSKWSPGSPPQPLRHLARNKVLSGANVDWLTGNMGGLDDEVLLDIGTAYWREGAWRDLLSVLERARAEGVGPGARARLLALAVDALLDYGMYWRAERLLADMVANGASTHAYPRQRGPVMSDEHLVGLERVLVDFVLAIKSIASRHEPVVVKMLAAEGIKV